MSPEEIDAIYEETVALLLDGKEVDWDNIPDEVLDKWL
jgi:hypothetical protein